MKRGHWILLGLLTVVSVVLELFGPHEAGHDYWWTHVPAFFVLYGFIGCAAIVYLSKWYGKFIVQRKEGYYETIAADPGDGGDAPSSGSADPGEGGEP